MRRRLAGVVDEYLLRLTRVHPILKQSRGVRIGRSPKDRTWTGGERGALLRINYVDRLPRLLVADDKVARAVHHDRAFTDRNSLRCIGGGLDLHDVLRRKFHEIVPAEIACDLERRIHDRATI